MTRLHIIHGPEKGRTFDLKGDVISVGRGPDNDIQIKHNSVSRRHLKIMKKGQDFFIEDLKSTNHTYLDGQFVIPGKPYEAGEGIPITIGKVLVSIGEGLREEARDTDRTVVLGDAFAKTGMHTVYRDRPETHAKNLELIYKVSNALVQSLDLTDLMEKIMESLFDLLARIDRGAVLLVDRKTGALNQIISRSKYDRHASGLSYSRTIVQSVIDEGHPITVPDMQKAKFDDLSDSMGVIRSVMCVPLLSRSRVLGVIYVDSVDMPHGFRGEDVSLLTALAGSAAVAIENALLYSNLEKIVEDRTVSLKETEEKLRESRARFKAIFDNMSSGVTVYQAVDGGKDFTVLDMNKAGRKIEGMEGQSVAGKPAADAFPEVESLGLLDVFKRVWKTGRPEHRSVTLGEEDKVTAWREYDVYRLPSGEVVSIFDDVTEKMHAEVQQKDLEKQLFASQKMESIGAFAGGTAHNFRNILQAISGNVEYLELLHGGESDVRKLAESIYGSVEKGVDLINNLLHFSKRGREPELVPLNLRDVIMEAYEIISKVFDKKIEIQVNLDENLPVTGSRSLLSQVFMNLFTNARDAMPDGGTLRIQGRKSGSKVVTVVSDTGHGMEKEIQEKIFDPFFTLKEVGDGTGLGLSTSHGIVEQHKGSISVASEPGKGTAFRISLPLRETAEPERAEHKLAVEPGGGEKVLIVDDEPPVLEALCKLAQSLGYEAIGVDGPEEAVENYLKWSPDVVLMDRSMPGMDGITCIKKIMLMDPGARVIIVSGYEETGADGIDEEAKGLIKGYLTKPCAREDLGRALISVLDA